MRIVVAPQSEDSDQVLAHLLSWSQTGLLRPFCWWTGPVGTHESTVEVRRVSGGKDTAMALPEALAGVDARDVGLVACYPAKAATGFDSRFVDDVDARLAAVIEVLPFTPDHPAEFTMIVLPAAIGQPVPSDMFRGHWAANIYVAPEDRRMPEEVNRLPHNEDAFPAHAAHALATLADLWDAPDAQTRPVLAGLGSEQTGSQVAPIRLARCFSRVIDFGHLADDVAAHVFRTGEAWPNPDLDGFERIDDPSGLLTVASRNYVNKHEETLGLTVFAPLTVPEKPALSLLDALRLVVEMLIRELKGKPFELADQFLGDIYERAADKVEHLGGGPEHVRVRRWPDKAGTKQDLSGLGSSLPGHLTIPDGPVTETWTDLRNMSFGLIDGTDLPAQIDEGALKRNVKRVVVTDPAKIAPDPQVTPPATPNVPEPRACDPLHFDPRFVPGEVAAKPPSAPTGDGGTDAPAAPEVAESGFDLQAWAAERRGTVLWMVGASIAQALHEARAAGTTSAEADPAAEDASARTQRQQAEQVAERNAAKRRRSDRRRLRLLVLLSLLLAAGVAYLAWTNLPVIPRILAFVVIAVVWAAAMARLAWKRMQREETAVLAALQQELDVLNESMLGALRTTDAERLERRYGEYLDWAEIIARLAHRPWVDEKPAEIESATAIDPGTLPAACSAGLARTGERVDQLAARARRSVFQPRWLTGLYTGLEHAAMTERILATGASEEEAERSLANPAGEASEDPDSALRHLREAIRRGDRRHPRDSELSAALLRSIDEMTLDAAAAVVDPLPPSTSGATASEADGETDAAPATVAGTLRPSEFLAELVDVPEALSFLPNHWYRPDEDDQLVASCLPDPPLPPSTEVDGGHSIGLLSGGARFHEPLRVLTRRVDLARAVSADRLTSCQEQTTDDGAS
jgi:hypothetical protein